MKNIQGFFYSLKLKKAAKNLLLFYFYAFNHSEEER